MHLFETVATHDCESLHVAADPVSGLRAVIAVHSTKLGPSLGGTRFRPYPTADAAVLDACRLARAMTYKHAVCGNDLGGGKAVIVGAPASLRSPELLRAYARFIDSLGGRYLTAEDVGTTQADMDLLSTHTRFVTGTSEHLGGSGDPSPATAWGVRAAVQAVARRLFGTDSLEGRRVVVIGTGKVGSSLARHLARDGVTLVLADVRQETAETLAAELGASTVSPDEALTVECDIVAPCALGGVLDEASIPTLRCRAVCGAANNQLATADDAERLAERGILYAPDYVVNAGGVINIAEETAPGGYDRERALARVATVGRTLDEIFDRAAAEGITPAAAADRIAEDRLAAAS